MAWFKFGKQDASSVQDTPVETVETMRTRAKRRLIGALVLVVMAVVGFPLLFETQPRPALVDVPIEIPDKAKVKPLAPPTALSVPAAAAKVEDKASLGGKEEIVASGAATPTAAPNLNVKPPVAAVNTAPSATKSVAPLVPAVPDPSAASKAAVQKAAADKDAAEKSAAQKSAQDKSKVEAAEKAKTEAAKAQALLDGKAAAASPTPAAAATAASAERFIVQFGSFADEAKAREVRQKVERAGLKTYAQIAETAEGKRHRTRVGPFATRAEAEKAATKIKSLDLPANILTL